MQALVLIEELGSIRAAAQTMNLTQPALTAAIQRLEAELKAPLLVRSRQGVTFTNFGQAFLKHAKLMVAQSRRAQDEIAQTGMAGRFRVFGTGFLPRRIVPRVEAGACLS